MKKNIFFLLSVLGIFSLNAQDSLPQKKSCSVFCRNRPKPVKDTINAAGPNEIYLNIGPVFSFLQGSFLANEVNFSLFYKRALENPRIALRTGFSFKPQSDYGFYSNTTDWYFDQTDSIRTVNKFQHGSINKFQLNAGMEYRSKGNKRWTTFVGADIIGGYFNRRFSLVDFHEVLDSTGQWNIASDGIEVLDYTQSHNFYIGISPKAGIRYAFNSKWMMAIQTGADFSFSTADYYNRNSMGTQIVRHPASSIDFNITGIIEEFSIVYRF